MEKKERKKRSRTFRRFRAIFILIIIALILLLLDGRFGLGPGGSTLLLSQKIDLPVSESQEITNKTIIEINQDAIYFNNTLIDLESLQLKLQEKTASESLYVLKDAMGNYGLFTQVQSILEELSLTFTVED